MPNEVWVMKQLDSDPAAADCKSFSTLVISNSNVVAAADCAHAAFPNEETDIVSEMRESVEIRCVCFTPE